MANISDEKNSLEQLKKQAKFVAKSASSIENTHDDEHLEWLRFDCIEFLRLMRSRPAKLSNAQHKANVKS